MKKFILIAVATLALASCTPSTSTEETVVAADSTAVKVDTNAVDSTVVAVDTTTVK